jgi:hypothetical protein
MLEKSRFFYFDCEINAKFEVSTTSTVTQLLPVFQHIGGKRSKAAFVIPNLFQIMIPESVDGSFSGNSLRTIKSQIRPFMMHRKHGLGDLEIFCCIQPETFPSFHYQTCK